MTKILACSKFNASTKKFDLCSDAVSSIEITTRGYYHIFLIIMQPGARYFVEKSSIVREIWGKSDTILFIFAGAAAEFALNKAVDWLYYTGKLPADPLGRLFSTVTYARQIIFSELEPAHAAIDRITHIHSAVEKSRNDKIPDWAYRDVLYMLIHYSVASYELLERKLSAQEKDELYDVFLRMGSRMHISELPPTYPDWEKSHEQHLRADLVKSELSIDLFKQYRKHLGLFRYRLLLESQKMVVPKRVIEMFGFNKFPWLKLILPLYKFSRLIKFDWFLKLLILPSKYRDQIRELDIVNDSV